MPYKLTPEQQDIIDTVITLPKGSILKVEAVAGASKTYTLVKIAEALHGSNCLYLAYNKAIATEASSVFPRYVQCKTTHSLAYDPIIMHGLDSDGNPGKKRTVDFFTYKSISDKMDYEAKLVTVHHLEAFFLSKFTSIPDYISHLQEEVGSTGNLEEILNRYFYAMVNKEIPVSHAFYLKYFHILLADDCIHYDKPFDLLMLDEAGDINAVTLEIFKLLPADIKVMVGDSLQNIYSFNHTINGFKALKDTGTTKHLSQSFRCSTSIASRIQDFCQRHIDPTIVFKGTEHTNTTIESEAILSRTNGGLVKYMITLVESDIPFNLTRPAQEIFNLMLILMNLKPGCKIYDARYKHLADDMKTYNKSSSLRAKYKSLLSYIDAEHGFADPAIKTAITTLRTHTFKAVYDAYNKAKFYEKSSTTYPLTLSTAHSSKGLTFDKVTVAADFDLTDILEMYPEERSEADTEALRLYYVTCSRARLVLDNAIFLEK